MLEAIKLRKTYPAAPRAIEAVAEIDLVVEQGEFVAIVGPSGSGKSTLLACLGGQSRPTGGNVIVDGVDMGRFDAAALAEFRCQKIGFVFQFASLLPALRAIDNVALPAIIANPNDGIEAYRRAELLLRQVGLGDRLVAYPGELSGGQQRKVALARALINRPPLLLADEPTSDLDEVSEREVLRLLVDLHRHYGTTLVVVTHSERVADSADRIVQLRSGRVAGQRTPATAVVRSAEETRPPETAAPGSPGQSDESSLPAPQTLLPGRGAGQFAASFAIWLAVAGFGLLAANMGTALLQRRSISQREVEQRALEEMGLQQVRSDVAQLTYGEDGSYRLTLYLLNTHPERPVYAMAPNVRVYIQVDRGWVEAPSQPVGDQQDRVTPLSGRREFVYEFTPASGKFEEQIAGYMHVRITGETLISRSAKPEDGLFERIDDYYVYLKPHHADDAAIMKANGWSSKPPLWIPMPAH